MKRYIHILTAVLCAGAALVACSVKETNPGIDGPKNIRFSAAVGSFQVKATDTAFEQGDAVGLFVSDPISLQNGRLNWDGKTLVPEKDIVWEAGTPSSATAAFLAYYPYSANVKELNFAFTVPADQTKEEALKAADLMLAANVATPEDEVVALNFAHRMSRLVVVPDNRLADLTVKSLTASGLVLTADVDLTVPSVTTASAEAQDIKAAPVALTDGTVAWAMMFPPQVAEAPVLSFELSDGTLVKFEGQYINFREGISYVSQVIIDNVNVSPEFTVSVTDWVDSYLYIGKDYDPGKLEHIWQVNMDGVNYNMEEQADGTWYVRMGNLDYTFTIVRDGGQYWGAATPGFWGRDITDGEELEIPMCPDSYTRLYTGGMGADLWWNDNTKTLKVKAVPHEWEPMGTGKMVEAIVSELFGIPHEEVEVEVFRDKNYPNIFRIVDPYKNWSWRESFNYWDGAYMDLTITDTYENYSLFTIGTTWLGLNYGRYGDIYAWGQEKGYYDPDYGYFEFPQMTVALSNYDSEITVNSDYMASLTLPGFERPRYYGNFSLAYAGTSYDEETQTTYAVFNVVPQMDVKALRYGFYAGHLSRDEVYNNEDNLYQQVIAEGTLVEGLYPENDNYISIPVSQTGTYTVVFASEYGPNRDSHHGVFAYCSVVLEGDEAPEPSIEISSRASDLFPDLEAVASINFKDPAQVNYLAVKASDFVNAGYTEDNIYDLVMNYGAYKSVYYIGPDGFEARLGGLEPSTEYLVMVAGETSFGYSAWASQSITTAASPEFTSMGTGTYTDDGQLTGWMLPYSAEVEFQQAQGQENRYRVVGPYKAFWENPNEGVDYAGFSADYMDFVIDGDNILYADYWMGYYEPDYDAVYYSRESFNGYKGENNVKLAEGAYNIAPFAIIGATRYYYDFSYYWNQIYVVFPGYTYTPAEEEEQPNAVSRRNVVKPANMVEMQQPSFTPLREIRPVKHHMLKTGAPKLTVPEITPEFAK